MALYASDYAIAAINSQYTNDYHDLRQWRAKKRMGDYSIAGRFFAIRDAKGSEVADFTDRTVPTALKPIEMKPPYKPLDKVGTVAPVANDTFILAWIPPYTRIKHSSYLFWTMEVDNFYINTHFDVVAIDDRIIPLTGKAWIPSQVTDGNPTSLLYDSKAADRLTAQLAVAAFATGAVASGDDKIATPTAAIYPAVAVSSEFTYFNRAHNYKCSKNQIELRLPEGARGGAWVVAKLKSISSNVTLTLYKAQLLFNLELSCDITYQNNSVGW